MWHETSCIHKFSNYFYIIPILLKVLAYPCVISRVVCDYDYPFWGAEWDFDGNGAKDVRRMKKDQV